MIEIRKAKTNIVFCYIIFSVALGLFAAFSLTRIQQPVAQDELHWLVAANTFYTNGVPRQYASPDDIAAFSPHLYLQSIILAFRLLGQSEAVARVPGIVSGLLAITIVFLITRSFSQGDQVERIQWAALVSLLYASTPAAIQGAAIIDLDNSVLVPAILFLFFSSAKYQQKKRRRWALMVGLAMAIALWARVNITPIVALLLSLYVFISKGNLRSKLLFIASLLVGTLLFTVSWRLYCSITGVPFLRPFTYAIEAFQHNRSQSSGGLMLRSLISLILWVGILPSLLLLAITIRRCRRYRKSPGIRLEDIFLWIGVVFILGYTLIGSASFGYPKYHSPAIPLLYIFVGLVLSRSKLDLLNGRSKVVFTSIVVVVFAAFIIQTLVVGDLLYVYRYTLRNAIAFGLPLYPVLKSTALKMGIFSVAFIIVFVICSRALLKKAWILPLILLSVGANIGTAFLQSTANYYTGYDYGGQGTIETVQYIRQKVPLQSVVLAPSEIIYYLKLPKSPHLPNALWTDTNELTRRLTDKNTSALAYSIVTNTIQQIQTIHSNGAIQEFLHRHFGRTEIGSYIIWIRENS